MENVIDKGYAERVPEKEIQGQSGKTWFIPHHGVYHPRKPEKIRVVFDCAARYQGVSLNDVLLQGPDLTNNLTGTLLRFRQEPVAIMGDVEAMYYQVKVQKEDRDFQRFYWWAGGDYSLEPEAFRMKVHLFGTVSSSSCANYALQKTAEDNKDNYAPEIITMIQKSFYVAMDDCLASSETERNAVHVVKEISDLCSQGGFHIGKWVSNSRKVMKTIPTEERAKDLKNLELEHDSLPSERALGVYWLTETDKLNFKIKQKNHQQTKRGILSVTSSVFDPLGFAAPAILPAKQILQILCRENLTWDEPIPSCLLHRWEQWLADLHKIENMEINRCYKPENFGTIAFCQLHLFSDASDAGYGVVAYLRLVNERDEVSCCFVMAKSRVAPLTKISVPRMELTAATTAARMSKLIARELQYPIAEVVFWTDSMSVIRYVRNQTARFHTFVANRVATIREASNPEQWRFVNSKLNPADVASREAKIDKFLTSDCWIKGTNYLWEPETMWPREEVQTMIPEADPEIKKSKVNCAFQTQPDNAMNKLLTSFSDWNKLKRSVAYFILVKRHLQKKIAAKNGMKHKNTDLRIDRGVLEDAEKSVVRYIQGQFYKEELVRLKQSCQTETMCRKMTLQKGSSLCKLDPLLDEGIIRVGGRLDRAHMPYNAKHPIILPKASIVTKLLLEGIHKSTGHSGKNTMLATLRQNYWVPGAGTIIKGIVSKCVPCRKYKSVTKNQKMADLPADRLIPGDPPFTRVGVDYFGPFHVKRGRATVKRYGVIFTCLALPSCAYRNRTLT